MPLVHSLGSAQAATAEVGGKAASLI